MEFLDKERYRMDVKLWHVRNYQEGDEQEIVELFRYVFHRPALGKGTLRHWEWKFKINPYAKQVLATLACINSSEKIIGQFTVMPLKLNFMGEAIPACLAVDAMVHPSFQRQGIFGETARRCYNRCVENELRGVYGFPNKLAYPGHIKLQWKKIGYLNCYIMRLNIRHILQRLLKFWLPVAILSTIYKGILKIRIALSRIILRLRTEEPARIIVSNSCPKGYESLWNAIRSYEVLSVWKDSDYISWRYEQNPDNKFDFIYLSKNEEIKAFSVVLAEKEEAVIYEFLVRDKDVLIGRLLLLEMLSYYLKQGKNILIFSGMDSGYFRQVFRGFEDVSSFKDVFCGKVFEKEDPLNEFFSLPFNWTVTYGDLDAPD